LPEEVASWMIDQSETNKVFTYSLAKLPSLLLSK
jgi:hypothetical protein